MKKTLLFLSLLICTAAIAQHDNGPVDTAWKHIYRPEATKINDLVNTKLDVKFDYSKSYMYGKEWLTIHTHFYQTDSLHLDAKGMTINKVSIVKDGNNVALKYTYDRSNLFNTLDKSYKATEQ